MKNEDVLKYFESAVDGIKQAVARRLDETQKEFVYTVSSPEMFYKDSFIEEVPRDTNVKGLSVMKARKKMDFLAPGEPSDIQVQSYRFDRKIWTGREDVVNYIKRNILKLQTKEDKGIDPVIS